MMTTLSLLNYGPFKVNNCIPYTKWKIEKIEWNTQTNKVKVILSDGIQTIIEESNYSVEGHKTKHTKATQG